MQETRGIIEAQRDSWDARNSTVMSQREPPTRPSRFAESTCDRAWDTADIEAVSRERTSRPYRASATRESEERNSSGGPTRALGDVCISSRTLLPSRRGATWLDRLMRCRSGEDDGSRHRHRMRREHPRAERNTLSPRQTWPCVVMTFSASGTRELALGPRTRTRPRNQG